MSNSTTNYTNNANLNKLNFATSLLMNMNIRINPQPWLPNSELSIR